LRLTRELSAQGRPATWSEKQILAGWSSWGAVPQVFDQSHPAHEQRRVELGELLSPAELDAARRTTINAHYTDPAIAAAMWDTARALGFAGGQVLEPGSGSGTFIGLAPPDAAMTGIELDPVTARISALVYPQATIRAESFADSRYPPGHFDAAIGNVPFADVVLHDRRHNPHSDLPMHDHFLVKALDLVRPGGLAVFLTSRYTLDRTNPAGRRAMYELADLVGAVRLPTGAHRRTAGTEVVTDLLVFRRREADRKPRGDRWIRTEPRRIGEHTVRINRHYAPDGGHPDQILGELRVGQGMHHSETLHVVNVDLTGLPEQLRRALAGIVDKARTDGLTAAARPVDLGPRAAVAAPGEHWAGHIAAHPDGSFTVLTEYGGIEDLPVPTTQARELRLLLGLRDLARDLLTLEAPTADDTPELEQLRTDLHGRWADYVTAYGPINRYTWITTSKVDDTGTPVTQRRTPPVMRHLRSDPFGVLVKALEVFDDTDQTARPAARLRERVVAPRPPVRGADTPADALAICMNEAGRVEVNRIAELLGVEAETARRQLGELVFDDPGLGRLVPAAEYLSGNVRAKLDAAQVAATDRPDLAGNVAALNKVQPAPLGPAEITARIGAVWIPDTDHQQFLQELSGDLRARVEYGGGTVWEVRCAAYTVAATSQWGTGRRPIGDLMQSLLSQSRITVHDKVGDVPVLNETETEAAREKARALQDRFADWVWEHPARAARLVEEYNRRFNGLRLRTYDTEGAQLTLPGLARTFTPRWHQLSAVARMISEPAVGLFHQVGAGKTAEMVIGAMELRRLGMARKPALIVPNHMLEQITREWLQLYPQARLLAAGAEDLQGERRRQFVARAATNDWDAVVLTQGAFYRIPVSPDGVGSYISGELALQRDRLERAKAAGKDLTIKRLEKAVLRQEERLKQRMDGPRDAGIHFEETGVDYLIVDEAHLYKNLATVSNISDAAIDGSQRATDLHMKLELLRDRHGDRVVTMATATPIANGIAEAHVMQRYLRPDVLRDAGVEDFDAWAATFGEQVTEMEMKAGGGWSEKTRLARYQNVPELLAMWQVFADVKTAEDLNLPVPAIRERLDGRRWADTVSIPPSQQLKAFMSWIAREAETPGGRDDPAKMLRLYMQGRAAALDLRLISPQLAPPAGVVTKLDVVADRIAGIYADTKDNVYLDDAGEPSPVRGSLQLVFCDLSTPGEGWNAYDQLHGNLTARGVPGERVRFIHEAKTDADKARLFAACRAGHVAVLIGSTAKMGVGTNVQTRAIALHDVDCPWRPADLEQRAGRILRQGNQNTEVGMYRYVVQGSFDTVAYQVVERKQRAISQIMRGRLDIREIEDVGDAQLSMAETKAIASGDPLILEQAQAGKEVARLERLARAHQNSLNSLSWTVTNAGRTVDRADHDEPLLIDAIARTAPTRGEAFAMTVGRLRTAERVEAGTWLGRYLANRMPHPGYGRRREEDFGVIARAGGHDITARSVPTSIGEPTIQLALQDVPRSAWSVTAKDAASGLGLIRQVENHIAALPTILNQLRSDRDRAQSQREDARAQLDRPFKHTQALADARAEQNRVRAAMAARQQPRPTPNRTDQAVADPDIAAAINLHHAAFAQRRTAGASTAAASPAVPQLDHRASPGRQSDCR